MALEIDWFFQHVDWLHLLSVPIFTGVGWLINWTGLIMLFSPVRFHGDHHSSRPPVPDKYPPA